MAHNRGKDRKDSGGSLTRFARGARLAVPVVMGYAPIGLAYGVIARQSGLSPAEAALMSALVYAGSAQFIACGLISSGAVAAGVVGTTLLVNLRHVLYSMSLLPRLRHLSQRLLALVAFGITDETYGVAVGAFPPDEPADWREIAGLNFVSYVAWVATSLGGAVLGVTLGDGARLGMDFALPAMFIGLLVMQLGSRMALLVAAVAGAVAIAVATSPLGRWATVIATVVAASVGTVLERAGGGGGGGSPSRGDGRSQRQDAPRGVGGVRR
ncbi:MAG: AzlC family ABC transporter permease [Betaproteobacteria bacterium]